MHIRLAPLVIAALLSFSTRVSADERAGRSTGALRLRGSVAASFGTTSGVGPREVSAPALAVEGRVKPSIRLGRFRIALPLAFEHFERIGEPLDTTSANVTLLAGARLTGWLRFRADASVGGVRRVGWPDLFQPRGSTLVESDRFSHFDRSVGARAVFSVSAADRVAVRFFGSLEDGTDDPAFQPVFWPDHIAPSDHQRTEVDLSWKRTLGKKGRLRLGVALSQREDFFRFAQDAGTGHTHAGPGGAPPNPLRRVRGGSPWLDGRLRISRRIGLEAGYALRFVDDPFEGYQTTMTHAPWFEVRYRSRHRVALRARAQLESRHYGEGSYSEGPGHPPLDEGKRRYARRVTAALAAEAPLAKRLFLTASVAMLARRTNFPDYVSGVHPANRRYDIDWDYDSYKVLMGLRTSF